MPGPICLACRKPVTAGQAASAVEIRDADDHLKGIRHGKCKWRATRTTRIGGRHSESAPAALDAAADHVTADDLTEEALAHRQAVAARLEELRARSGLLAASYRSAGRSALAAQILEEEDRLAAADRQVELARAHAEEPSEKPWSDWRLAEDEDVRPLD